MKDLFIHNSKREKTPACREVNIDIYVTGIIPAQGEADVAVTFAPFEFQTALMKIQLTISQFNSKPIVCQFTGSSVPGLLRYNLKLNTTLLRILQLQT